MLQIGTNDAYLAGVPTHAENTNVLIPPSVPVTTVRYFLRLAGEVECEEVGQEGFYLAPASADELNPYNTATLLWYVAADDDDPEEAYESSDLPPAKAAAFHRYLTILERAGLSACIDKNYNGWHNWVLCITPTDEEFSRFEQEMSAVGR